MLEEALGVVLHTFRRRFFAIRAALVRAKLRTAGHHFICVDHGYARLLNVKDLPSFPNESKLVKRQSCLFKSKVRHECWFSPFLAFL
jgi:hypothetical protein